MNKKELLKPLKNKLNNRELTEIFRYNVDDCSMLVWFNSVSENLSLVFQTGEFCFDGCKILRNSDISEISTSDKNENLKFVSSIYSKEKLFPKNIEMNIDSWNSVFSHFKTTGKVIMAECSYDDAVDYYFGKVVSVKDKIIQMQCFDGAGNLFNDIVRLNTDYVSSVTFDDRYTQVMSKYINL